MADDPALYFRNKVKLSPLYLPEKLDIRDGIIYYKIRQQGGQFQTMSCQDTLENRIFVNWVQIHDGYSKRVEE